MVNSDNKNLNETLFISAHAPKVEPKVLSPTPYQVFEEKRQNYKLVIVKKQQKTLNNKNGFNFFTNEPIKDWLIKKVYSVKQQPCMNTIVEKAIKSIYPCINKSANISASSSINVTPKNKTFIKPTFVIVNSKDKDTISQTSIVKLNTRSISINESSIKFNSNARKIDIDYEQVTTNISPIKPRKESINYESPAKSIATNTSSRFFNTEKKDCIIHSINKAKISNFNSIRY